MALFRKIAEGLGARFASIAYEARTLAGKAPRARSRAETLSPPEAPRLKFRFADAFRSKDRARTLAQDDRSLIEADAPDPSKILVRASGDAGHGGRASRYAEIEAALKAEARALDSVELGNAGLIAKALGGAILGRLVADQTWSLARLALWATMIGFVVFFFGFVVRSAGDRPLDPFGFGAGYFFAGFLGAAALTVFAEVATSRSRRAFATAENNLVALVAKTTKSLSGELVQLRADMTANSAHDLPKAIKAATQARLATVAGLRFFDQTPLVGAGEGNRCAILAGELQRAGRGAATAGGRALLMLLAAAFGAALIALLMGSGGMIAAFGEMIGDLFALEASRPGVVLLGVAVAALLIVPIIIAPVLAVLGAAADPGGVLARNPARSLADSLQARALSSAAEREREMIERYADALESLEARAAGFAGGHGAAHAGLQPSWRRPEEGPRFVAPTFAAAPKAFLAEGEGPARGKIRVLKPAPKRDVSKLH